MKIIFDVAKEKSGANIWTERLCSNLQRYNVPCSINHHSFFNLLISSRFTQFYEKDRDIIHHANSWNGWAFKTKNPLIITEHTAVHDHSLDPYKSLAQRLYHNLIKQSEKRSLESADSVTCVSKYVKKFLENTFDYYDSNVIMNGVDTDLFRPYSLQETKSKTYGDKKVILFVGNLTRLKGADLLHGIMNHLGDQYILLVTSGFKHNVNMNERNIINIGTLDQNSLINAYNLCDIFLVTSRLEGFGLSIAEAMACGKPVVATNCSAIPELVVHGYGGFLCKMNDVDDFSEKIRNLSIDENLCQKMGEFNRKRAREKFELSRMVREYIDLYKSL